MLNNLNQQYKENRDNYHDNFRLRIHRALSWLSKAEEESDLDMKFISLWIAFNAAYAREIENVTDRAIGNEFLMRICSLDEEQQIYDLVWKKFSNSIRLLLDNQFVFQPFWDFHNGKISEKEYKLAEMREREKIFSALENQKTAQILGVMFNRLYTLRNQIVHGGSTYGSIANRNQLKDGCNILSFIIPAMLKVMLDNHSEIDWGKPFYPFIKP